MPIRITAQAVNGLKPRGTKFIEYDQEVKGFGVRVEPSGRKSFVLTYRTRTCMQAASPSVAIPNGRWQRHARKPRSCGSASRGATIPCQTATAPARLPPWLIWSRTTSLVTCRPSVPAHARTTCGSFGFMPLPALGKVKVADIDHKAVAALHSKITKRGTPTRANAVKRLLSKKSSLSIRWGYRTDNPCIGVVMNQEHHRERFLSPAEAVRLMKVLASHQDRESANVIMLALLTGARRNELLKATWDQFDLQVAFGRSRRRTPSRSGRTGCR